MVASGVASGRVHLQQLTLTSCCLLQASLEGVAVASFVNVVLQVACTGLDIWNHGVVF